MLLADERKRSERLQANYDALKADLQEMAPALMRPQSFVSHGFDAATFRHNFSAGWRCSVAGEVFYPKRGPLDVHQELFKMATKTLEKKMLGKFAETLAEKAVR